MRTSKESSTWGPGHDLALIYLSLMHGADAEIDPTEHTVTVQKLRGWFPDLSPEEVDEVMQETMLVYVGGSRQQMLEASVASLRHVLSKGKRIAVLNDLADIASADGFIVQGEVSFIQQLAHLWDVAQDIH